MVRERFKTPYFLTGFIACAVCMVSIVWICVYLQEIYPADKRRTVSISPLEYVKLIRGNFQGAFADIFYISGILAITDDFPERAVWLKSVQDNFAAALLLDPKLVQGYFFAGVVIARDKQSIKKGIEFLEKYRSLNSLEWRIPYWIGFNYFQKGDHLEAAKWYQKAAGLPGAPAFLKSNQPMLYYKAGRPALGIIYLNGLLTSVKNPKQLEWITAKLSWLKNMVLLEKKVNEFKSRHGKYPKGLDELVQNKLIMSIPEDPFGQGYYLDRDTGRIKSRFILFRKE